MTTTTTTLQEESTLRDRVRLVRIRELFHLVNEAEERCNPIAAKFEVVPEHWVHDGDEGLSYCRPCAEKEVKRLLKKNPKGEYCVDGGWGSEGDSQASCETCQAPLDNSFTTYCCESELDHFEQHGFDADCPEDCYSFCRIVGAEGCESSKLIIRIIALAEKILNGTSKREEAAA